MLGTDPTQKLSPQCLTYEDKSKPSRENISNLSKSLDIVPKKRFEELTGRKVKDFGVLKTATC